MSDHPVDPTPTASSSSSLPPAPSASTPRKPVVTRGRPPVRRPDLDTVFSINPDGSRNSIHTADVSGRFQTRKQLLWFLLLGVYLAMPWVKIGGNPAVLIDIPARHFFLFGNTFNAQDFWLAFFFITGLGFTLFMVAALFGRMWCGYACPQTVFLEGLFRRVERWIEGPAPARHKLDKAPWTAGKLLRRGGKLLVFFALAAVIAHSLLGYFMPVERVVLAMTSSPTQHPTAFLFALVVTLILFINFTWFREQLCIVVCPYGRLQGALYDYETLLVGYDRERGEPRGPATESGHGHCVDCYRCVAVCPTGIDIRNGTQMECIGCANCIDACDEVMLKTGRPKGLVRYDSQRGFETGARKFVRPRVFLYAVLLVIGVSAFLVATTWRTPFEANLRRVPGQAFTLEQERVHNVFDLHLINKQPVAHTFVAKAIGPAEAEVVLPQTEFALQSLEDRKMPVHVFVPRASFRPGMQLEIEVRTGGDAPAMVRRAKAPLLGPSGR
ncbi:MAG: cytochrome c oxidase accessory protein CcoG [Planctomycetes bacterium]|nr:cytochrome c oxidase accessory protein CcoG [Planctomycetota bacterium]